MTIREKTPKYVLGLEAFIIASQLYELCHSPTLVPENKEQTIPAPLSFFCVRKIAVDFKS